MIWIMIYNRNITILEYGIFTFFGTFKYGLGIIDLAVLLGFHEADQSISQIYLIFLPFGEVYLLLWITPVFLSSRHHAWCYKCPISLLLSPSAGWVLTGGCATISNWRRRGHLRSAFEQPWIQEVSLLKVRVWMIAVECFSFGVDLTSR